ncbi:hypothetical protein Poli38472_003455 [Pythium oligandrum]|uniref:Uncharacterized protein n=1 Tax=Pythium oligandrum TaxID=41045 RepID=A0A8K1C737_PYTOL|nr:hypothetical protein Poli38472_003455 [Pythium oligandrum]|eukprot:TMW57530.1 hypothetical protein Poli38472_003455 [Pythium oligandrum]
MGIEHSLTLVTPAVSNQHSGEVSASSWPRGWQYTPTDVAIWPQCASFVQWFTAHDACVLHDRLRRRPRASFLTFREFCAWLTKNQVNSAVNDEILRLPTPPVDIMTPPSLVTAPLSTNKQPPSTQRVMVAELALEHLFTTFAGKTQKLYAPEFLAAMTVASHAIWQGDEKVRLLMLLFQDAAQPPRKTPYDADAVVFKEADVAKLFLSVLQGLGKLTVGLARRWECHGLNIPNLARALASDCLGFSKSAKRTVTVGQMRAYYTSRPGLVRFLGLFSGESVRNPFTFGVTRSMCDGLPLPFAYKDAILKQKQQYEQLVQRAVTFEGRQAMRQHSAATLIQSTWRRRYSQFLLERNRQAHARHRHASAIALQSVLKQWHFAKVLEQHADAELHAYNGAVLVAGMGPAIPRGSNKPGSTQEPAPLQLVDAFKLRQVQIVSIALSSTCALALTSDRQSLFAWGRCLPCVYEDDVEAATILTQPGPRRLATRFSAGNRVQQLACGLRHALVLTEDGNVFSWGFNDHGQLGHGSNDTLLARTNGQTQYSTYYDERDGRESPYLPHPTKLIYFQGSLAQQAEPIPIQTIVCGDYYSLALSRDGDVFTWGDASEGQLGHGEAYTSYEVAFVDRHMLNSAYTFLPEPEPVLALSDQAVVQVACRKNHSVALTKDSRVFAWGNWGRRTGSDREHAFVPEEVHPVVLPRLRIRQLIVGDHHMIAEGASLWLSMTSVAAASSGSAPRLYLACAISSDLDAIEARFVSASTSWTCVLIDGEVDNIEGEPQEEEDNEQGLWAKRMAPYALQDVAQVAVYDGSFTTITQFFPEQATVFRYEHLLTSWLGPHMRDRLAVFPRGKPAGLYIQFLLPVSSSATRGVLDPHEGSTVPSSRMVEFPVCGATTTPGKLTRKGLATHVFHPVMRERLLQLPTRVRKVMPTEYMEPHSVFIIEFDESCCGNDDPDAENDEDDGLLGLLTRSVTVDGEEIVTWSDHVVQGMTQRILEAQEAGALCVLIVLDILDADPFELELSEDAGVYIPVLMLKKTTHATRYTLDPTQIVVFSDILYRFTSSQALEEHEDVNQAPTLPSAWAVRCFERVDTTRERIQSALKHGASGVVFVQDEQSIEMDGETAGAPIGLAWPTGTEPKIKSDDLIVMISHSDGQALRAASHLALTSQALPFVPRNSTDQSPCELLVGITVELRPGGTTYAWGDGQNGRLGLGDASHSSFQDGYEALTDTAYRFVERPTAIAALAGHEMKQLVCGTTHNVAVTEAGRVFTWGKGVRGALAQAKTREQAQKQREDQRIPRMLHHLHYDRIIQAAANDASSMLLTERVSPDAYAARRKEITQLKAAARKSLLA